MESFKFKVRNGTTTYVARVAYGEVCVGSGYDYKLYTEDFAKCKIDLGEWIVEKESVPDGQFKFIYKEAPHVVWYAKRYGNSVRAVEESDILTWSIVYVRDKILNGDWIVVPHNYNPSLFNNSFLTDKKLTLLEQVKQFTEDYDATVLICDGGYIVGQNGNEEFYNVEDDDTLAEIMDAIKLLQTHGI